MALGIGGIVVADVLNGPEATRDEETQEVVAAGSADALSIQIGDCFDDVDAEEFDQLPVVPCDNPHDNEAFHAYTIAGDEWPGDEAILEDSLAECDAVFAEVVGLPYEESTLDWWLMHPTQSSWLVHGDRQATCVMFDPAGQVSGSLAGAER